MQNNFFGKKIGRFSMWFLVALTVAALTGCGGAGGAGGGAATATTSASGVAATATTVQLLASSQQMLSSATASTLLTAIVLDANGQAMSGKTVNFSRGAESSAYFSDISATTSANGAASVKLNIGGNMANRVISVSAMTDTTLGGNTATISGTNTVTVTGTKIAVSGNTSLALGASSKLTIIVKDSTGAAVPGVALAVASKNGNPILLTTTTTDPIPSTVTDSTGQMIAYVTADNAGTTGTDVLTVTGAGTSQTQSLTINSASFNFTSPAIPAIVPPATTPNPPEIVVNTPTPITVHWANAGVPVADGTAVSFYTSRGVFAASGTATTLAGNATLNVTAGSTGATILTASGAGGTPAATLNVVFITTSANLITAQASPGTVAFNTVGSITNQSVISVVVRDVNNNLVKNAHVVFSQLADASGGSLAANTATTDITGTASVNYIAGTTSSGQNGVNIRATVDTVNGVAITPISTSVFLTVASQTLYVRLGTDNKVVSDTPAGANAKSYLALVTDSAGNPAPDNTQVRFVLRPVSFSKGKLIVPPVGVSQGWIIDPDVGVDCPQEDTNLDGILQTGEDINGNGRLDPWGVATVNTTALTTSGFAIATITYAKEFASWVTVDLEARAGTIGNDPPNVVTLVLPGADSDYRNLAANPPGLISPFGVGSGADAVCTNMR